MRARAAHWAEAGNGAANKSVGPAPAIASTALDVWSFGVLAFELGSGRPLFAQDLGNDELVGSEGPLCAWGGCSTALLADLLVLPEASKGAAASLDLARTRRCLQHLVRWCLSADPNERPTAQQLLAHALFDDAKPEPSPLPEAFFGFLSHMQAQAAADAAATFALLGRFGLWCWLDMNAGDLTLEGMCAGVRASKVFLLILTTDVLTRPFCQTELLCAIGEGKRVIVLVEEDPRFARFDREAFARAAVEVGTYAAAEARCPGTGTFPAQPIFQAASSEAYVTIVAVVAEALAHFCVPLRRREHETRAMAVEIARLGGLVLPPQRDPASAGAGAAATLLLSPLTVCVVAASPAPGSPAEVVSALGVAQQDLEAALLTMGGIWGRSIELVSDVAAADKVVVLLAAGTLAAGSASLAAVVALLAPGSGAPAGKLLTVYLPAGSGLDAAAFEFGGAEVLAAPAEVQSALHGNEALVFRPRVDRHCERMLEAAAELLAVAGSGAGRALRGGAPSAPATGGAPLGAVGAVAGVRHDSHEWAAMVRQLGVRLGCGGGSALGGRAAAEPPSVQACDLRRSLAECQELIATWEERKVEEIAKAAAAAEKALAAASQDTAAALAALAAATERNKALRAELAMAQARAEQAAALSAELAQQRAVLAALRAERQARDP
jgi:hypothetical protein